MNEMVVVVQSLVRALDGLRRAARLVDATDIRRGEVKTELRMVTDEVAALLESVLLVIEDEELGS